MAWFCCFFGVSVLGELIATGVVVLIFVFVFVFVVDVLGVVVDDDGTAVSRSLITARF